MPHHEILPCPRCQASFECKMGSITLCHCSSVELSRQQREIIAQQWDSCLCHQCLVEIVTQTTLKPMLSSS